METYEVIVVWTVIPLVIFLIYFFQPAMAGHRKTALRALWRDTKAYGYGIAYLAAYLTALSVFFLVLAAVIKWSWRIVFG